MNPLGSKLGSTHCLNEQARHTLFTQEEDTAPPKVSLVSRFEFTYTGFAMEVLAQNGTESVSNTSMVIYDGVETRATTCVSFFDAPEPEPEPGPERILAGDAMDGDKAWVYASRAPTHRDNTLPFTALGTTNRRILSNLARVNEGIVVRGTRFLTVEAAYVCHFKFGGAHSDVFGIEGTLGSLRNFVAWRQSLPDFESVPLDFNPARWHGADGVIAKLAGSGTRVGKHVCRVLNLGTPVSSDSFFQWDIHAALWRELHQAKYEASVEFRTALYQTRFFYLYEADTKCARKTGRKAIWGGCFDKQRIWRGENIAGRLLMHLRSRNGIL